MTEFTPGSKNDYPTILVFDSGAGGLTVAKEILTLIPACNLVYASDSEYFPYGTKFGGIDDTELSDRIVSQVRQHVERNSPDIVVLACNTASTLALDALRREFSCPFVGVVPAIKPAAKLSQSGVIGLLATSATVQRNYTKDLIKEFAADQHVLLMGSDVLVEIAESKLNRGEVDQEAIEAELDRFGREARANALDTIVLACTHFPLLRNELEAWACKNSKVINWVDSGLAIAKRVLHLLEEKNLTHTGNETISKPAITFAIKDSRCVANYSAYLNS